MDYMDEQFVVYAILQRLEAGETLSEQEQVILAYSPYGYGKACSCKI